MLSYQHHYHAGSLTDIHKHRLLISLLGYLTKKERPITYMETHSGRAFYDTSCAEAQKTGEAAIGIEKLILDQGKQDQYIDLVKQLRLEMQQPSFYPGSPLIAKKLMRDQDVLFLMELHPGEIKYLYDLKKLKGPKTHIHHRDGYEGVLALSPPKNRRGLVLIDPSYEIKSEYDQVANFCTRLYKKWPEAIIMIWYPILKQGYHEPMKGRIISSFKNLNFEDDKILIDEINFKYPQRMIGSGILIIGSHPAYLSNSPGIFV